MASVMEMLQQLFESTDGDFLVAVFLIYDHLLPYTGDLIFHAALGLVPSTVTVVVMQVYSRVFLVCGVLLVTSSATTSPGLPLCMLAWSITEIIRYSYYAVHLLTAVPQVLLFLRYSSFLVLYPMGITGELLCMYHSLDDIAEQKLFTVSLPNEQNFFFDFYYFVIFYMVLYIPLVPVLFRHMHAQRRKMLTKKE